MREEDLTFLLPPSAQVAKEMWGQLPVVSRIALLNQFRESDSNPEWWEKAEVLNIFTLEFEDLPIRVAARLMVFIENGNPNLLPQSPTLH